MPEIKLEDLKAPLPSESISPHPTKPYLSSIKAIYVTERFNQVFGVGKWTVEVETEHTDFTSGMIVVKTTFKVPELDIMYQSFGGNDNGGTNNKNFDLGDAYKGATTDALTKIGSYLGVGIDVFKGKAGKTQKADKVAQTFNNSPAKKEYTPPPKGWINDPEFNAMKGKWKAGDNAQTIIKTLRDAGFGVNKEMVGNIEDYITDL